MSKTTIRLLDVLDNKKDDMHTVEYVTIDDSIIYIDCILEARGYGDTIHVFTDTQDKFVITPQHFGYSFNYPPFEGSWGDTELNSVTKTKSGVQKEMIWIAKELNKYAPVWLVDLRIACKGYVDCSVVKINPNGDLYYIGNRDDYMEEEFPNKTLVLFDFSTDINLLIEKIKRVKNYFV